MSYRWIGLAGIILAGCSNTETAIVPLYAVNPKYTPPTGGMPGVCEFGDDGDPIQTAYIDVALMPQLGLNVKVQNTLNGGSVTIDNNPDRSWDYPQTWRPVRFDYSWECDSHQFLAGLPPLVVPAFSVQQPFCTDLTEDTEDFKGTDVVPISGEAIPPRGEFGLVHVAAVNPQTRDAIRDTFEIARLAEACCAPKADGSGGCYDADGNFDVTIANNGICTDLDNVLRGQSGDTLSTQNPQGVELFRPFVRFTERDGAYYPMRLHGSFEGLTGDGSTLFSADYRQEVGFCAGDPASGDLCYNILTPAPECANF